MILKTIVAVYPSFLQGRDAGITTNIWATLFADDPFKTVEAALLSYISNDTKGFPPSPGQIKEKLAALKKPERTETEAWALVAKALHNGLYGYKEEYAKLPAEVQSSVGSPEMLREWAQMDENEVQSVVASNFQRSYRARAKQVKEYEALPASVREALPGLAKIGLMPGREE